MKSLKQYIKLIEAVGAAPDGWIANINVGYSFPTNNMIPFRTMNIEKLLNETMASFDFTETGSGGGFGERDISYANEGNNLADVLANAKNAFNEINKLAKQIERNLAKLGVSSGLEINAYGYITDSEYKYDLNFDDAEEVLRQSQQIGKK